MLEWLRIPLTSYFFLSQATQSKVTLIKNNEKFNKYKVNNSTKTFALNKIILLNNKMSVFWT